MVVKLISAVLLSGYVDINCYVVVKIFSTVFLSGLVDLNCIIWLLFDLHCLM